MVQMEKINFMPEEREAANAHIRAQLKRTSEDDAIREEEREKSEAEKAELLQIAEAEKVELLQKADIEKAELLRRADEKAKAEKAELLKRIKQLEESLINT